MGVTGSRRIGADIVEVVLDAAQSARARAVVAELAAEFGTAESESFLRRAPGMGHLLPPELVERLVDMRYLEDSAAIVVRCEPMADPGPTPAAWRTRGASATVPHDFWLALVLAQLGDPMGWANLQDGRLFNDILPQWEDEHAQTSYGSGDELELHVEEAYHDVRSDAFGLLCLRNPGEVPTTVASSACLDLDARQLDVLRRPRFRIGGEEVYRVRPMLSGPVPCGGTTPHTPRNRPDEAPHLRLDVPYVRALPGDTEAERALEALKRCLRRAAVDIATRPGDMLIVDNHRAVHGRRPFRAGYDGRDRWLRRLSVIRDLRTLRGARSGPDGRVVTPDADS